MGSKKVKAIVVDLHTMPQLHDRKKSLETIRTYAKLIQADPTIQTTYTPIGTMADGRLHQSRRRHPGQ